MTRAELRRWARDSVRGLDCDDVVVEMDAETIVQACRAVLALTAPVTERELDATDAFRAWADDPKTMHNDAVAAFTRGWNAGYRAGATRKARR